MIINTFIPTNSLIVNLILCIEITYLKDLYLNPITFAMTTNNPHTISIDQSTFLNLFYLNSLDLNIPKNTCSVIPSFHFLALCANSIQFLNLFNFD